MDIVAVSVSRSPMLRGENNPGFLLIGCLEQQPLQTSASFFHVGKPSELFMMFMFIVKAFFLISHRRFVVS